MELIDNTNRLLGDDLKQTLKPGARLKIAASCFSIYAFEALKTELEGLEELNFIFTSPTFVANAVTDKFRKERKEFHIPKQAAFWCPLPKSKVYEHSHANTRLKDLFVAQVEKIVWQYKLAPETINLPAKPGVPEVQVFAIQLKSTELHLDVLRCIDGAVQYPIVFELSRGVGADGQTQVLAAYKRPNEADASRWVVSDYFATAWLPSNAQRAPMPLALDLGGLYQQVLQRLIPLPVRQQESLVDLIARVEHVASKRRAVEMAASKLAKEKQFNRKVEINATLRQLKTELEQLSR